jgi:rhodanese-related sulfurtransferase
MLMTVPAAKNRYTINQRFILLTIPMSTVPFAPDSPAPDISVQALAQKLEAGDAVQLIDVREPWEVSTAAIDGFVNLPLSEFAHWETRIHQQFEADAETLVLCHHGMRSAQMCQWLRSQGFAHVRNVVGGIDAYAQQVDASMPRY